MGWVVTRHGLMTGLLTGGTAFGMFFVIALIAGLTILRPTTSPAATTVAVTS